MCLWIMVVMEDAGGKMDKYISLNQLKDALLFIERSAVTGEEEAVHSVVDAMRNIKFVPADVEPVRRGWWEFDIANKKWSWDYPYMCDQFGEWVEKEFNFCPNCGAKMEGE